MTKNKFIKTLRGWRVSESTIKNCTNAVAYYSGTVSYDDIYKMLRETILTEMFKNYPQPIRYEPIRYDMKSFDLNETSKDNYLLMNTYGTKVIEPMYVRRTTL